MDKRKLGNEVYLRRERAGLSQEQLSGKAKIANRALQRIEAGDANPTLDTLCSIAKILNCDVWELLGPIPRPAFSQVSASPKSISELTIAELEALVARASKRDGAINLQLQAVKAELQEWLDTGVSMHFAKAVGNLPKKLRTLVEALATLNREAIETANFPEEARPLLRILLGSEGQSKARQKA